MQHAETKGPEVTAASKQTGSKYSHRYGNKPPETKDTDAVATMVRDLQIEAATM